MIRGSLLSLACLWAGAAFGQAAAQLVEKPSRIILRSVQFAFDSATVDAGSLATLDFTAKWMAQHPEARLRIEGHSSAPGGEAYNLELSRQRALGVQRVLVDYRVSPDRLEAVGRGESEPIASNDTPEGRALNRRVEFVVIQGGEAFRSREDSPASRASPR